MAFVSLAPSPMAMNAPSLPSTNYYLTLKEVAHLPPQPNPFFPSSFSQPSLPPPFHHLGISFFSFPFFLLLFLFFFVFFLPAGVVAVWFRVSVICSICHFVTPRCVFGNFMIREYVLWWSSRLVWIGCTWCGLCLYLGVTSGNEWLLGSGRELYEMHHRRDTFV